jgi:dynein light chain LC8-type
MSEDDKKILDVNENSGMFVDAQTQAKFAVESFKSSENKIAAHIKFFFDNKYGPNWHCFAGKSFNSYVSYENKHFMFFYEGQTAILLYKMG